MIRTFKKYLIESVKKNVIVFYGGRFQPMHKGHFELYKSLVKQFGKDNVYIATKLSKDSIKAHAKGDFSKDPLTFTEKINIITKMFGIPKSQITETDPYRPNLESIGRDPKTTSVVLAFSEKDAGRLVPGNVMQPYPKDDSNLEPLVSGTEEAPKSRMYYLTMPVNFSAMSASDFRAIIVKDGTGKESQKAFKEFFGTDKVDASVLKLLASKLHKKLNEVKNEPPEIKRTHKNHNIDSKIQSRGGERLGSGSFASAYSKNKKDVPSVTKVSILNKNRWESDGYYNYLMKIKDLKMNPYLPQINKITRLSGDEEGEIPKQLIVDMEKLYSIDEISTEQLERAICKICDENDLVFKKDVDDEELRYTLERILSSLLKLSAIGKTLADTNQWGDIEGEDIYINTEELRKLGSISIKDKDLVSALKIVHNLYQQGFNVDLHGENFMFRKTPYGAQVVLTDPLSFRDNHKAVKWRAAGKEIDPKIFGAETA